MGLAQHRNRRLLLMQPPEEGATFHIPIEAIDVDHHAGEAAR
jgi:hypothetical protein